MISSFKNYTLNRDEEEKSSESEKQEQESLGEENYLSPTIPGKEAGDDDDEAVSPE